MIVGTKVQVLERCSKSFGGQSGRIVAIDPSRRLSVEVRLDDDGSVVNFAPSELVPLSSPGHIGGAECVAPLFLPIAAASLRSDAFALNVPAGSAFAEACALVDRDDATFISALGILLVLVTLTSRRRGWSR